MQVFLILRLFHKGLCIKGLKVGSEAASFRRGGFRMVWYRFDLIGCDMGVFGLLLGSYRHLGLLLGSYRHLGQVGVL